MKRSNYLAGALVLSTVVCSLQAAVADGAKALGGPEFTAFGSQKTANADGSIPAYTGEPIGIPSCYDKSEPNNYCDPWNDNVLYTVTAQNLDQYADKLTEGQKALFKQYPDFKMQVYPTRRTARFPDYFLANTAKNVDSCKTGNGGITLEGCYGGVPFPFPKTGNEVIWNHQMQYNPSLFGNLRSYFVDGSGRRILVNAEKLVRQRLHLQRQSWPA